MENNIILTFEEVFCDINFAMYNTMLKNISSFGFYLYDPMKLYTNKEFNNRPVNTLSNFCRKDLSGIDYFRFNVLLKRLFYETDFCNGIKLNNVIKKMLNPTFLKSDKVDNIFIICEAGSDHSFETKKKFINKHFSSKKIKLIRKNVNQSIEEIVEKLNWTLFVTENIKYVIQIAEDKNIDLEKKEFLIKKTGYNKMPEHVTKLIEFKNASIRFYKEEY